LYNLSSVSHRQKKNVNKEMTYFLKLSCIQLSSEFSAPYDFFNDELNINCFLLAFGVFADTF